jgi:threonylcarbamoyladenosine tRNA methylthiotransferase MtaB
MPQYYKENNEIIDFCLKDAKKFVPHFHIPLQSGSDELLKKMRRKYLSDVYVNRVEQIKRINPDTCIGVDVIVGFPGETDEEFMITYNFLKELDISYLHVFTYSERANTTANKMEGAVPMHVRKDRSKMLHILSDKKKRAFYESQVAKEGTVLWESENNDGWMYGFTENYIKMKQPYNKEAENTFEKVIFEKIDSDGLMISKSLTFA